MKNFLKKNIIPLLILAFGLILMFCGTLFIWLLPVGSMVTGGVLIFYAIRFRKKFVALQDEVDSSVFDARTLDYDEDVYVMGDTRGKPKAKTFFERVNAQTPVIIFGFIGLALVILGIITIFRLI